MHPLSFLKGFLQLLSWLGTQGGVSPRRPHKLLCIFIISSRSAPSHFRFHLCTHMHTHSLYLCKGSSKLLVVGPHLCRADGCFSAPHGQHSGDEGSSLRRKRLSICFSNCSSSSSSHLFRMASAANPPQPPPPLHISIALTWCSAFIQPLLMIM